MPPAELGLCPTTNLAALWLTSATPYNPGFPCKYSLAIFETPCDREPPTEKFKNFKFFQNSFKVLNVYFWGDNVDFWGDNVYFRRDNVYFWWDNEDFGIFEISFLLLAGGGFGDSVGRGAP